MAAALKYHAQRVSSCTTGLWIGETNYKATVTADQGVEKIYKYIYFLFDVAITNAYILMKSSG